MGHIPAKPSHFKLPINAIKKLEMAWMTDTVRRLVLYDTEIGASLGDFTGFLSNVFNKTNHQFAFDLYSTSWSVLLLLHFSLINRVRGINLQNGTSSDETGS